MLITRLMCVVYWPLLTVLLLVPDPLALLGIQNVPDAPGVGVHFLCFAALAVLVWASRFPLQRAVLAGLLVGFAVATETLQLLVPPRTVELRDFIENLLGLAVGSGACWVAQRCFGQRADEPKDTS